MAHGFSLRKELRDRLVECRLTASELARRTGVPRSVLSDWLAGAHPRNVVHLLAVARELGTSIEVLCFGADAAAYGEGTTSEWTEGVFEGRIRLVKRK